MPVFGLLRSGADARLIAINGHDAEPALNPEPVRQRDRGQTLRSGCDRMFATFGDATATGDVAADGYGPRGALRTSPGDTVS